MDLCNRFLTSKTRKLEDGDFSPRTFKDYKRVTDRLVAIFGKGRLVSDLQPDDFAVLRKKMAEKNGPIALHAEIARTRAVFNFAKKNHLIEGDVKFGTAFDRPSKKLMRQQKAENGKKLFSADECRRIIEHAQTPELKGMILLGLNAAYGNTDCSRLPLAAVNLETGWLTFPRPKTQIERRCPLWPETVAALQVVMERREQDRELVFITRWGNSFENDHASITKEYKKLIDKLGVHRRGLGFYTLRHVFRTVADSTLDFPAIRQVMGHADGSIDAVYREQISDERLKAVTNHVHKWLFAD